MLALGYLILLFLLGDSVLRRFFTFESIQHRLAAAFLAGLLISASSIYGLAIICSGASQPLIPANLFFLLIAVALIFTLGRGLRNEQPGDFAFTLIYQKLWSVAVRRPLPSMGASRSTTTLKKPLIKNSPWRPAGNALFDWIFVGSCFILVSVLMAVTMGSHDNVIRIAQHHWNDFGPNSGIIQNFVFGHNFPAENTHFAGELIRHHFLFWFQAANLEYLGFDLTTSINVLSVLSMVAALVLMSVLGEVLFRSRAVGRIGALLFFASGSLAYTQFFNKQDSFAGAIKAVAALAQFIPSGYPYRGEEWGIWTVDVFLQQRHFISGIGILLIVFIFVVRHLQNFAVKDEETQPHAEVSDFRKPESKWRIAGGFAISGILIGLLPLWNSAVFVSAFLIFFFLFLLFRGRGYLAIFAVVTAIVCLPEIYFMSSGTGSVTGYPVFRFGYVIVDATVWDVVSFLAFSIGFKWILIATGLAAGSWNQARVFISVTSVLVLAFLVQFSPELVANHKFINIWLVFANSFAAFGLWTIWKGKPFKRAVVARTLALILFVSVSMGGILDFVPIWNEVSTEMPYKDTRLIDWIRHETEPEAVFLSKHYVGHDILLAGRKLFYGHQLFAWSAGLNTENRDKVYARMFSERNPKALVELLNQYKIRYVAIDNQLRDDKTVIDLNESVYQLYFEKVFDDTEHKFGDIVIFRVPGTSDGFPSDYDSNNPSEIEKIAEPTASVFSGGIGTEYGQFKSPRGLAVDASGNIYVTDPGNARVQKFDAEGMFLASFGINGTGEGQLKEPNGIAIDDIGNIYVTDAVNHKLLKFQSDGVFLKEWQDAAGGFYGPRDIGLGPNKSLYIVDQGRTRIVRFDPLTESFTAWGTSGSGEGQFREPTGIAFNQDSVFVADMGNDRIQKFDLEGNFIQEWGVTAWGEFREHFPDIVYDDVINQLYISNGKNNEILGLDLKGNIVTKFVSDGTMEFKGPSSMVISNIGKKRRLLVLNNLSGNIAPFDLQFAKVRRN